MEGACRACRQNQFGIRGPRERRNIAFNLGGISYIDRRYVHTQRWCNGLNYGELPDPLGDGSIAQNPSACDVRRDFLEQFNPLRCQIVLERKEAGGIAARPRHACDIAVSDRIRGVNKYDRDRARGLQNRGQRRSARGEDNVRRNGRKLRCVPLKKVWLARGPSIVDLHIPPVDPTQRLQSFSKRLGARNRDWVVSSQVHQRADTSHALALLRPRRDRPCRSRAAEQRDELAPDHSITSSARASIVGGTSWPSAFAVLRLMTSSNLVGACTGRSAGFAPRRMRST